MNTAAWTTQNMFRYPRMCGCWPDISGSGPWSLLMEMSSDWWLRPQLRRGDTAPPPTCPLHSAPPLIRNWFLAVLSEGKNLIMVKRSDYPAPATAATRHAALMGGDSILININFTALHTTPDFPWHHSWKLQTFMQSPSCPWLPHDWPLPRTRHSRPRDPWPSAGGAGRRSLAAG